MICATYNILHGYYQEKILANIRFLINEKAELICLQELDVPFEVFLKTAMSEDPIFQNWKLEAAHNGYASNLGFLWNSESIDLLHSKNLVLPTIRRPSFAQVLRRKTELFKRTALVGIFSYHGEDFRVTNAHLSWEGGMNNRLRQLDEIKESLREDIYGHEIICGDFNTFSLSFFGNRQSREIQEKLGRHFKNTLPDLKWSCDISYQAPVDGWRFPSFFRRIGLRFRSRLDYIFVRNFKIVFSQMLDLPGSDHRPLVAELEFNQLETHNI